MTLCFLDTETTSLGPDRLAWDIAMIRRGDDGTETEVSFFVDVDLSNANPQSLAIGRFYERHPMGRFLSGRAAKPVFHDDSRFGGFLRPAEAAAQVARFTHGATVVGAVPSFDAETLAALLRAACLVPAWHHRLRCVESIASGHVRQELGGLRRCAEALGLTFDMQVEHTALGDARICREIWDEVIKP